MRQLQKAGQWHSLIRINTFDSNARRRSRSVNVIADEDDIDIGAGRTLPFIARAEGQPACVNQTE